MVASFYCWKHEILQILSFKKLIPWDSLDFDSFMWAEFSIGISFEMVLFIKGTLSFRKENEKFKLNLRVTPTYRVFLVWNI